MKKVFKYVWRYKLLLVIPSLAMLLSIVIDMFNPYLTKIMIDDILVQQKLDLLAFVLISMIAITLGRAVMGYVKEYLFDVLSVKISVDLKKDLFDHIQSLPYSYFDNMNTGELMSRIGEDVDNIWRTVSFGMRLFVENAIYFVMATCILFYLNWKLTIICLITMPFIGILALKLEKKEGDCYERISDHAAVINTTAQENIAGVRLVKAFARERHEAMKFLNLNQKNYDLNVEQNKVIAKFFPPMEFLSNLSVVLMVAVGGIFVMNGKITIGTLVAFNSYIWMLIWPMRMLGWLTNMLAQNKASAKKVFNIMMVEPTIKDKANAISLPEIKGDVEFKNVSFKYNEDYILRDVSFTAPAGSTVAIMGTTGSGKSSIISLIGRYYDAACGQILIDGHDVKDVVLKDLRSKMSVVAQDNFLFSETVAANIRFGKEDASMEEIVKACEEACAAEFIDELEEGYDTLIGERGIGLSGGQKQRIAIARALVRDSRILILDDSTSALDMDTEFQLLKNLNSREANTTTFIIAHRISAVKNADKILFVEDGRIVEEGTHSELVALGKKYYDVYCAQFKDFEEIEGEVV